MHTLHPHFSCCGYCREVKRYRRDQETQARVSGKCLSESRAASSWWSCLSRSVDQMTSRGPLCPQTSCEVATCSSISLVHAFVGKTLISVPLKWRAVFHVTPVLPPECGVCLSPCHCQTATIAIPFSTLKDKTGTLSRVTSVSFNIAFLSSL